MFDSFKPAGADATILASIKVPIAEEACMFRLWSVVSLVLLAAAAPSVAQQPGSAGATRPKLEVLQSLPEAQLFPVMNLVATSLGVHCDHCHVQATPDYSRTPSNAGGWVWDRDDKESKRRARDMMKMVVELNASRFGGESKVTCFTCHRGAMLPSRLPTLPPPPPGSARTARPTPLPTADRVLAAYLAAVGRIDAPAGTGMSIRGWDERPEGRYGKFEITVAGSDRYRIVLTTPEATTNQGLAGDLAWAATNAGVQRLSSPADLARMRRIAMRYRPVKEQPQNLRVVGIARVDDRRRLRSAGKARLHYHADVVLRRSHGLLRRELTTTETLLVPLMEQVDYDEYRDVNGVQMPFRVRISDGAPYSTTTRTILEIRRNVPVSDTLFRPPTTSALKPPCLGQRSTACISAQLSHWAKILVQPRECLTDPLRAWHIVSRFGQAVSLVIRRGAEQPEERLLRNLGRIEEIVFAVEHQRRRLDARQEVQRIHLWASTLHRQARDEQHTRLQPWLQAGISPPMLPPQLSPK
jgi:hypothetical protein